MKNKDGSANADVLKWLEDKLEQRKVEVNKLAEEMKGPLFLKKVGLDCELDFGKFIVSG